MNNKKLLNKKLVSLFQNEKERAKVREILESYGEEKFQQEPDRVRLAVLKLSGTDISEIENWTKRAKEDYRDILAWAEYPRQSKHWSMPDGSKKKELIEADKQEYVQWLYNK